MGDLEGLRNRVGPRKKLFSDRGINGNGNTGKERVRIMVGVLKNELNWGSTALKNRFD